MAQDIRLKLLTTSNIDNNTSTLKTGEPMVGRDTTGKPALVVGMAGVEVRSLPRLQVTDTSDLVKNADLDKKADTYYVDTADAQVLAAAKAYVDQGGGPGGEETDPIYMEDKANLATITAMSDGDAKALSDAKIYTDQKISALPTENRVLAIETEVDDLESALSQEVSNRQGADTELGNRITELENKPSGITVELDPVATEALKTKSDIYIEPGTTKLVAMADLKEGDNLSGATLILPTSGISWPGSSSYYKGVTFTNGGWYGINNNGTEVGVFDMNNTTQYLAHGISGGWNTTPYVFPEGTIVKNVNTASFRYTIYSEASVNLVSPDIAYDCKKLREVDVEDEAAFTTHQRTDVVRWNDYQAVKFHTYVLDAKSTGKKPSETQVDIPITDTTLTYTCDIEGGAIIGFQITNTEEGDGVVTLDGVEQESFVNGLPIGVPLDGYITMKNGEELVVTHCTYAKLIPLVADTDSSYAMVIDLQRQFVDITARQLAVEARLDGKILDPDPNATIDIESMAQGSGYTVPTGTGLGGQITGAGVLAIIANTGVVYRQVNGTGDPIIVFDNRSALGLGLGEKPMQPVDVNDGDVITCSGMANIFFTPYIPRGA